MGDRYAIIVGGGIAGLFSAKILAKTHEHVVVIDKAPRMGGLLNSVETIDDKGLTHHFDYGTHFVLMTGDERVNTIAREDLPADIWKRFDGSLLEGHYSHGHYYEDSGCVNARSLPQDDFVAGYEALKAVAATGDGTARETLADALKHRYGAPFADTLYAPYFEKFTGHSPAVLSPRMENSFGPTRVIVADSDESKVLKADPALDDRIAYAHCRDNDSQIVKYYPHSGGVGQWVEALIEGLRADGVTLLTEDYITDIEYSDGIINAVTTDKGHHFACDKMVWTAPPVLLARALGIDVPSEKPEFCAVRLFHFVTDHAPDTAVHWANVYDPDKETFRLTFYDNVQDQAHEGLWRVTAEVLGHARNDMNAVKADDIFQEIKDMGLLPDAAQVCHMSEQSMPVGFPILTPHAADVWTQQFKTLEDTVKNLHLVGRHPEKGSGQMSILQQAYDAFG